jgi:hypothetical protein
VAAEVLAQVRRRAEAGVARHLLDRGIAGLQRRARGVHALGEQPLQDGQAGLGRPAAGQRAL